MSPLYVIVSVLVPAGRVLVVNVKFAVAPLPAVRVAFWLVQPVSESLKVTEPVG
jgi:hypothetical protein